MPDLWLPDLGEIDNPGWLEVLNVTPYAGGWLVDGKLGEQLELTDSDVRGLCVHPANGTGGWKIYYGSNSKLWEIEPSTWVETDRSGASYTPDAVNGWQMVPFGSNMVAVGGHAQAAQVRVNDAGNFEDLITNAQPDFVGFAAAFRHDVSAGTYVDITTDVNDRGASDAQAFPSGSAVGDNFLLGRVDRLPAGLSVKVGTAHTGSPAVTWQYYNGSWTNLSGVTDSTSSFSVAGLGSVTYTLPTDSVAQSINGSASLHWIRATVSVSSFGNEALLTQVTEHTAWPPRPKFVANWGGALAIANYSNVGPATEHGDPDPNGIWISDETGRIFGTYATHDGDRTTYLSVTDEHGDISGLIGGDEFGVILKPKAIYRVLYGGTFRVDIRVASSSHGSVFPNAWAWANEHELYLWTSGGPAVMTQSGLELLGVEKWQRAIFDGSWVVDTYPVNPTSKRYLMQCVYHRAKDVVSWHYRSDTGADEMDIRLDYHRASGRASVSIRREMVFDDFGGDPTWSSRVAWAAAIPLSSPTDWAGLEDVLLVATNQSGNKSLFTTQQNGPYSWNVSPTFTSPFLQLGKGREGEPAKCRVSWVQPLYSLNAGVAEDARPLCQITIKSKNKPASSANSANDAQSSTEDSCGVYKFSKSREMYLCQVKIVYGTPVGTEIHKIDNLAEIQNGFWIGYEVGSSLDK